MAINIPFLPILRPTLSLFRLKHYSKNFPLIFRCVFFYLVVSCVNIFELRAIYPRRTPNTGNHGITSESSYTSPIDTDNDRPFEPDPSETDLTELERSPLAGRTITRKKLSLKTGTKSLPTDLSNRELPEDYGRSNKTKKLKLRLKERWAWYYQIKGVTEDVLYKALLNDIYRFLNWCLKLEYSPDGRRQKGYIKASAFEADWKYFRIYYYKEIGEAVCTGMRYLVDKRVGSVRRTSQADDRTRALVCEKRPSNMFALPKIVYGVLFVFSPYVLLFIILFYVYAFKAPYLTSMEDLRKLLVEGGR
ncbi:hypothetical protein N7449_005110 [Penicillium cf. viridicatum]|uniref:Uncharacterized protein n=1 Tax=Penicillium cf. viridicatum TaxID=2972119 RepID=A0A9W9SYY6_9EURO|nr:hypothetical protein N7449_005110 [Penicillium cf. viridicatum]